MTAKYGDAKHRRGEKRYFDGRRGTRTDGDSYTADEVEFMMAVEKWKRDNRRPFPTWREVLEVAHRLGYRKTT